LIWAQLCCNFSHLWWPSPLNKGARSVELEPSFSVMNSYSPTMLGMNLFWSFLICVLTPSSIVLITPTSLGSVNFLHNEIYVSNWSHKFWCICPEACYIFFSISWPPLSEIYEVILKPESPIPNFNYSKAVNKLRCIFPLIVEPPASMVPLLWICKSWVSGSTSTGLLIRRPGSWGYSVRSWRTLGDQERWYEGCTQISSSLFSCMAPQFGPTQQKLPTDEER